MIDVERLLPLAELQGQMDKFVASAEAAQPFPGEPAAYLPGKLATMLSDARSRLLVCSARDVGRFPRTIGVSITEGLFSLQQAVGRRSFARSSPPTGSA